MNTSTRATLEILKTARELISKPENWCVKDSYKPVYPRGMAYCAIGAVWAASTALNMPQAYDLAYCALGRAIPRGQLYVSSWNDSSTHEEVLAGFDRAIEACSV